MATLRKVVTSKGQGYQIDYYDSHGNRKRKTVYCDRTTAARITSEIEYKKSLIATGLEKSDEDNPTLSDAVEYVIARAHKKPVTIKRERLVYNNLVAFLGEKRVRAITVRDISRYLLHRQEYGDVSIETVGLEYRTLKAFFGVLLSHELLELNPMQRLAHPARKTIKIRFLTSKEIKALLKAIRKAGDQDYLDLIQLYLHTGTRREEILKPLFTWDSVDLNLRQLTIVGKGSKTRYIPMDDTVYEILLRRKEVSITEFPFTLNYHTTLKVVKKYYKTAKIENANIHTLRRTFGSIMVQQGVDIFTVSKLLGHSSVTVSEKHYADLLPSNLKAGIDILERALKRKPKKQKKQKKEPV